MIKLEEQIFVGLNAASDKVDSIRRELRFGDVAKARLDVMRAQEELAKIAYLLGGAA